MKEKIFNFSIAILLLTISITYFASFIANFDLSILPNYWWTIYIIIFGMLTILCKQNKLSGTFVFTFGLTSLLGYLEVLTYNEITLINLGAIPLLIAIYIFKLIYTKDKFKISNSHENIYSGVFSEVIEKCSAIDFNGCNIFVFCGQTIVDLTDVKIKGDQIINVDCKLGNTTILLPKNVGLELNCKSFLASIHNLRKHSKKTSGNITITGKCLLGEINIK